MISLLAHRGHWLTPDEKNSMRAFERAFKAGHGVELDVRDQAGALVIAHDVPVGDCIPFETVLDAYQAAGAPGRIAVNIKADGLASRLIRLLADRNLAKNCFVFDMSVPDLLSYLDGPIPVFTRFSEFETAPSCYDRCAGVWLDAFVSPWASTDRLLYDLRQGKDVAVVSPELHRKPHEQAWAEWSAALSGLAQEGNPNLGEVMLCTDLPDDALRVFGQGSSHP